ncbi:MAG: DEAD/DEAH box helicase [Porcipelethomonas sp.]
MQFKELQLSEELLKAIDSIGFTDMTEIQEKSIPAILSGSDVIGRSNTGTGKTAAFGIPAVEQTDRDTDYVRTLILCPTRELALQASEVLKKFSRYMPWVKTSAVFGGASMEKQIFELKRGANIVVGTPGRVMDHIRRRTLKLQDLKMIILDEADEMLNMGFREDIEEILKYVPEERQTILFSATMPPEILAITDRYQNAPVMIKALAKSRTVEAIEQFYYSVPSGQKFDALHIILDYFAPKSSMVFCNTKKTVDDLTQFLISAGFRADGLHGDMKQNQRTAVMNSFKSGKTSILVATDVAARGIDVSGVDSVFNFDLPQDNEYYIHRIGRTGRAGKSGTAYTLVCGKKQIYNLKSIAKYTKSEIRESELPSRQDVISVKLGKISDKVKLACKSDFIPETDDMMNILAESGLSAEDIARALINRRLVKELKNIPEVKTVRYRNDPKKQSVLKNDSKLSKVVISVGKMHRIAPNFILGALVDATGMSGKSFGKIDIHDHHTTVEVPDSEIEYIIKSLNHGKINGNRVTVKKYETRFGQKNARTKSENHQRGGNKKFNRKKANKKK